MLYNIYGDDMKDIKEVAQETKTDETIIFKQNRKLSQHLPLKIIMILLIMASIAYFLYTYLTTNFSLDNKLNLFNLIFIFIMVIVLGITLLSNNLISIFFMTINYCLIICFIIINLYSFLPQKKVVQNKKEDITSKITCTGITNISNNTTIDIDYQNDNIELIKYIYTFELKDQVKAEEYINNFDLTYKDLNNIYSEISINDKIIVTLTYRFLNSDIEKFKNISKASYIKDNNVSYQLFKEKELNNLTCKNRN